MPFLHISNSATNQQWQERLDAKSLRIAEQLCQANGIDDVLARILAARGVLSETVSDYLAPTLRALMPDPLTLAGMSETVARLVKAIKGGESIAIFGDYDVDGACASALMVAFLQALGCACQIHIPDRILEGYGPNIPAIEGFAAAGVQLLICVDCGTMSFAPFEAAQKLGLDVVVIDHHQADEILPITQGLVNPNRQDDLSGLGYLCATGVAFMVLVALRRHVREVLGFAQEALPDLRNSLDLVALATIADVVPLTGLNRAFVRQGVQVIGQGVRVGLVALAKIAGIAEKINARHLGFMLGPRINAGGRIGDAALGAKLLLEQDFANAHALADTLNTLNTERRAIEKQQLEEAIAEVEASLGTHPDNTPVILVSSNDWHPGVLGLIAARLREHYNRPSFAIRFAGNLGTGSGRGVPGLDLGAAVRSAVQAGLLVKGGGHAMAAGLTVSRDKLGALRAHFEAQLGEKARQQYATRTLFIDAAMSARALTVKLADDIESAGPYGTGNPEPMLVLPNHRLAQATPVGQDHVRAKLVAPDGAAIEAIAFGVRVKPLGEALLGNVGAVIHSAGHIMREVYQGQPRVKFRLIDLAQLMP